MRRHQHRPGRLPGIGHACGHNISAASAVGAAMGLAAWRARSTSASERRADAVNHHPKFAAHCVTAVADRALIDGAIAMAWRAIDIATTPALRARLMAARG